MLQCIVVSEASKGLQKHTGLYVIIISDQYLCLVPSNEDLEILS